MKKTKSRRDHQSLKDAYFAGEISVEEYINHRIRSKEGDRKRRAIEQKFKRTSEKLEKII